MILGRKIHFGTDKMHSMIIRERERERERERDKERDILREIKRETEGEREAKYIH